MTKQGAFHYKALLGLLGILLAGQVGAAGVEMYRYVNDKGITVIDRLGVPPQYIGKGYQVLNDQGRVVREVPPAPTAAEIEQRKADAARASSDQQLMRMYTSVEDVDRARDRKLAELDGLASVARGNLQSLKTQQANLQARAADQERAGRQVPDDLVAQLGNLREDEQRLQQDIARYQQLRTQAQDSFAADRARFAQISSGN
ncbi:hypothetical protein HNP46_006159 [Pseudomonas nitritireducens]|uniref:DUF4124 domain-containing protein n=1 Tax=Pseudomonas nitroreducens TaxID=46680 RepID=A0A7W7P3Q6_PSENT|nr:hypothetical protein [Pseudomonas nitritireducens]